jgi:hypothetical protein
LRLARREEWRVITAGDPHPLIPSPRIGRVGFDITIMAEVAGGR